MANNPTPTNNKKTWRYLAAVLVVVLMVSVILRLLTKSNQTIQSLPIIEVPTIRQTNFAKVNVDNLSANHNPSIPPTLPLPICNLQTLTPELFSRVSHDLFQQTNGPVWKAGGKTLVNNDDLKTIFYSDSGIDGDFDAAMVTVINPETAIEAAQNFINILGLKGFVIDKETVVYGTKGGIEKPNAAVDANHANTMKVSARQLVGSYSLEYEQNIENPVILTIDSTNRVIRAQLSQTFCFPVGEKTIAILPFPDAINQMEETGKASVIQLTQQDGKGFDFTSIKDIKIESVSFEYRFFSSSNMVAPVYRLKGNFTTNTNQVYTGTILVFASQLSL